MLLHTIVWGTIGHSWTSRSDASGAVAIRYGDVAVRHRAVNEHPHCCARDRGHGKQWASAPVSHYLLPISTRGRLRVARSQSLCQQIHGQSVEIASREWETVHKAEVVPILVEGCY